MTGARIRSPARSQPSRARATNRDALQYTVSASARSAAELHTRSGDRALPSCPAPPVLTTARSPAVRRRRPTLGSTASTTGVAAEVGSWRSVVVTGLTRDGLATAEFGIAVGRAHVGRAAAEHTVACRAAASRTAAGHVVTGRAPCRTEPHERAAAAARHTTRDVASAICCCCGRVLVPGSVSGTARSPARDWLHPRGRPTCVLAQLIQELILRSERSISCIS
mgnify:CR=1 FL=1